MNVTNANPPVDLGQIEKIIAGYEGQRWALLPLLEKVQETVGYIPPQAIPLIADHLRLFPSQVQGVG